MLLSRRVDVVSLSPNRRALTSLSRSRPAPDANSPAASNRLRLFDPFVGRESAIGGDQHFRVGLHGLLDSLFQGLPSTYGTSAAASQTSASTAEFVISHLSFR